ncbi:MAG TPA: DsrE family protein [Candidatus Dormibacteraeota bacterium]|nr:DsrE family protein [Candidatus Dormibacteraeota bacterium]
MSQQMIFQCTYGKENPERAILPFVAANVAATAGIEATVVCTIDAVWLGTKGGAGSVLAKGLPPLTDLMDEFRGNGGKVWLCGACTKPRGITEADAAPGVTIVGAATIIEAIANGATPIAFA